MAVWGAKNVSFAFFWGSQAIAAVVCKAAHFGGTVVVGQLAAVLEAFIVRKPFSSRLSLGHEPRGYSWAGTASLRSSVKPPSGKSTYSATDKAPNG